MVGSGLDLMKDTRSTMHANALRRFLKARKLSLGHPESRTRYLLDAHQNINHCHWNKFVGGKRKIGKGIE